VRQGLGIDEVARRNDRESTLDIHRGWTPRSTGSKGVDKRAERRGSRHAGRRVGRA
jgi:hypothetical protein